MKNCDSEGAIDNRCSENIKDVVSFFQNGKNIQLGCSYENQFLKFRKCPSKTFTLESNPFKKGFGQGVFLGYLQSFRTIFPRETLHLADCKYKQIADVDPGTLPLKKWKPLPKYLTTSSGQLLPHRAPYQSNRISRPAFRSS